MKYFLQLLESYARLHESNPKSQLDPQALQLATGYFNQANSQPAPTIGGNKPTLMPVKEIGGNVYKNNENKVIYDNFPGSLKSRTIDPNGKGPSRQNFNDFVKLLSAQSGAHGLDATQPQAANQGASPGIVEPQKFAYFPDVLVGDPAKIGNTLDRICGEELAEAEKLPRKDRASAIQEIKSRCSTMANEINKLINNTKDSIANTLDRSTKLIVGCNEDDISKCQTEKDTKDTIEHRIAAFQVIKNALDILNSAQNRSNKMLTIDECAELKKSISITGSKSSKRLALISPNKKGMLITQTAERTTLLHDTITTLSKGLKCPDNSSFAFEEDLAKFLTNAGISGAASIVRGFFFEDLRAGVATLKSCRELGKEEESACQRKASEYLLRWLKDKESLIDALKDLLKKFTQDGELSVQMDDEAGLSFVSEFLPKLIEGGSDTEEMLKRLSGIVNLMARTASLGVDERRPAMVEKTATTVGGGAKSDMREYYATEEEARAAIDRMNLPADQKKDIKIVKEVGKDGKTYFTIGDSLKYSGDMKKVKTGQAAKSSISEALADRAGNSEWFKEMKAGGLSERDFTSLGNSINEHDENQIRLMNLMKDQSYINSDGKTISRNNFKTAIDAITKEVENLLGVDSEISKSMRIDLRNLIKNGATTKEIADFVSDKIYKAKLESKVSSSNSEDARSALRQIATMASFAGMASDGTLLTVADATKGTVYMSSQNSHHKKCISYLDNLADLPVEERNKRIEFNDKSINIKNEKGEVIYSLGLDGMSCEFHVMGSEIKANSSKRTLRKGEETRNPAIQESESYDTVMRLLLEQRQAIEDLMLLVRSNHSQR